MFTLKKPLEFSKDSIFRGVDGVPRDLVSH